MMTRTVMRSDDFKEYINSIRVDGAYGSFVPYTLLEKYWTEERTRNVLLELSSAEDLLPLARRCLRVMSILILIGSSDATESFLRNPSLHDDSLPFRRPGELGGLSRLSVAESEAFRRMQWQFCAHLFSDVVPTRTIRFDDEAVLPIVEKTPLKVGDFGKTYRVEIHPEYNHIRLPNGLQQKQYFALKTCPVSPRSHFDNEVEAYRVLTKRREDENLVSFYGSWEHRDTLNLLLEYANGGTLLDYFRQIAPPVKQDQILKFWSNLSALVKAVQLIHVPPSSKIGPSSFQGIHQDIKPENILYFDKQGYSKYDVTFKLADLGLTNFETSRDQSSDVESVDKFGTQMYSAPECSRIDEFMQENHLAVNRSIDIWSLGCVFSEAATWVVLGKAGLDHYVGLRERDTERVPGLAASGYSACFHDGERVLSSVTDMHRRLCSERRVSDHVTEPIVTLINDMLESPSHYRPNAAHVYKTLRRILGSAENKAIPRPYPAIFQLHERSSSPSFGSTIQPSRATGLQIAATGSGWEDGWDQNSALQYSAQISSVPIPARSYQNGGVPATETVNMAREAYNRVSQIWRGPVLISKPNENGERSRFPHVTVDQCLTRLSDKKRNLRTQPIPGSENLNRLDGRDQIFLIDDSVSMSQYWLQVRSTVEVLTFLIKGLDSDGIELRFANSPSRKIHSKERRRLIENISRTRPAGQSDMGLALGRILEEYHPDRTRTPGKLFARRRNKRWGVSIYVLTDGIWDYDGSTKSLEGVMDPIRSISEKLSSRGMLKSHVGIQFIRFGNDPVGTNRLATLDNDLAEFGVKKDIVDTEPFEGNVFKMLLGSLDPTWDNASTTHVASSQKPVLEASSDASRPLSEVQSFSNYASSSSIRHSVEKGARTSSTSASQAWPPPFRTARDGPSPRSVHPEHPQTQWPPVFQVRGDGPPRRKLPPELPPDIHL